MSKSADSLQNLLDEDRVDHDRMKKAEISAPFYWS